MTNFETLEKLENNGDNFVACDFNSDGNKVKCLVTIIRPDRFEERELAVKVYVTTDESGESDFTVGLDKFNSKAFSNLRID